MGKRVGVLLGGWGEEREISIKTGEGVALALEAKGHQVTRVLAGPGLDRALRTSQIEVAFVALHGRMGEDGAVQGLLEVLGLPYTGSGVLASALAMNKPMAKTLFRAHNVPTACGYTVSRGDVPRAEELHQDLGLPCVVKPSRGGSSVGLSVVERLSDLPAAVADACRFGGEALVERRIVGREVTVGLLGGRVLGTCEVSYSGAAFDFGAKYRGGSRYHVPARLSAARQANVEALALRAFLALGCRGYGRVDLICSEEDNDVVLEVNTLPGLTQSSLLPKIASVAGLSYPELCEEILARATLDGAAVIGEGRPDVPPVPTRAVG